MIYFFTAKWCSQCRLIKPIIQDIIDMGIPIEIIDVEKDKELTDKHNIMSLPTIVKGDNKLIGVKTKDEIIAWLKQ